LLSLTPAADFAVVGILVALFILYAFWQGTGLLITIALSLPIAGFLFLIFPYKTQLEMLTPWAPLLLFIGLVVAALWVLQKTIGTASGSSRALHIVTTAITLTLLLITFSYHIVPIENIYNFGSTFDSLFAPATNFFWVVALAILALFVV